MKLYSIKTTMIIKKHNIFKTYIFEAVSMRYSGTANKSTTISLACALYPNNTM